jgi:hypothetical protein
MCLQHNAYASIRKHYYLGRATSCHFSAVALGGTMMMLSSGHLLGGFLTFCSQIFDIRM